MRRIARRPNEIAECVSEFLQAGDVEGIASMFHPDCLVFFPPGEPPQTGTSGAAAAFAPFVDARPRIESQVVSEVIAGDVALVSAIWRVVLPDGEVMASGSSTEVARRLENGGWGYVIDCPNGPPLLERASS